MIRSMTGFASGRGTHELFEWSWELRAVNARGLDLRLRVPDWAPGLEAELRKRLSQALNRGSVTLGLRLGREGGATALSLDPVQLDAMLTALATVEDRALEKGISLAPSRAADLLALRGVLDAGKEATGDAQLTNAILADFEPVLSDFIAMRKREGVALLAVLKDQIDQIESLTAEASAAAEARRGATESAVSQALARVMDAAAGADPDRVAQELALIAVKADVTEEIDRLGAHVGAARELLAKGGAVGRKLDFLTQEFNREANTLCSKSQNPELTRIGLNLKAVIDQMREQVQNVE
ncbi:YicC/YloC family endoribonuclease [Pseudooceanicola sp.]|uniref:YicC/YloC family endoribonuclease n=1 Tax=Pseudooceanicola sp. TaxID=1914328 RepID=UPI0026249DFB|nr:YicC/YloC family endoribonuclease [Pseudooceanicola sp.]MDF1857279.1 YicC family protein [Pseudooceanicola sp.]